MRWKISRHGHDPRQVDLLAIIALLNRHRRGVGLLRRFFAAANQFGFHRAEPKRALVI
jgi:hypothetical protein